MSWRSSCLRVSSAIAAVMCSLAATTGARQDRPAFREAVDLIEVDVRVVTNAGQPVLGLKPANFTVTIAGKARRVVSADFVRYGAAEPAPAAGAPPASSAIWQAPQSTTSTQARGRIYLLYVDLDTFDSTSSRNILPTAASFIGRLQPNDQVGLFVFPTGSLIDPTTDHVAVIARLGTMVGTPSNQTAYIFGLRPSEVALLSTWLTALRPDPQALNLVRALCAVGDAVCIRNLQDETRGLIQLYESQAQHQLSNVRALLKDLASVPGHKTLVLMSGGIPTTMRPGARPDIASQDIVAGEEAQRSDTAIYGLYVDWHRADLTAASQRRPPRFFTSIEEDGTMYARHLDVFVGSAGGTFLKVLSGSGEAAFDQILRETSAYYVLGVEPTEADRDGKAKQLSVKINQPGATIHGSRWVTVPKR